MRGFTKLDAEPEVRQIHRGGGGAKAADTASDLVADLDPGSGGLGV